MDAPVVPPTRSLKLAPEEVVLRDKIVASITGDVKAKLEKKYGQYWLPAAYGIATQQVRDARLNSLAGEITNDITTPAPEDAPPPSPDEDEPIESEDDEEEILDDEDDAPVEDEDEAPVKGKKVEVDESTFTPGDTARTVSNLRNLKPSDVKTPADLVTAITTSIAQPGGTMNAAQDKKKADAIRVLTQEDAGDSYDPSQELENMIGVNKSFRLMRLYQTTVESQPRGIDSWNAKSLDLRFRKRALEAGYPQEAIDLYLREIA